MNLHLIEFQNNLASHDIKQLIRNRIFSLHEYVYKVPSIWQYMYIMSKTPPTLKKIYFSTFNMETASYNNQEWYNLPLKNINTDKNAYMI